MKFSKITFALFLLSDWGMSNVCLAEDSFGRKVERTIEEAEQTVKLAGKWQTKCVAHKFEGLGYAKFEYDFGLGKRFSKVEKFYNNDNCNEDSLYFAYAVEGQIRKLERIEKDTDIHQITFVVEKHKMTTYSREAADWAKQQSICNREDWRPNTTIQVDGENCSGYVFNPNTHVLDIYKKEDNQLRLGKASFLAPTYRANSRPPEMNNQIVYHSK